MNSSGQCTAKLRVGSTEYSLATASGVVALDGTTKYHVALDYDGTTIRLFCTVMGKPSADPADSATWNDTDGGTVPMKGYAEQPATGDVEQLPYEVTHLGSSWSLEFPEGARADVAITGRVGSIRMGTKGRRGAALGFLAPSNVLTIDAGAGATQGGCFLLSPRTARRYANGELWECTIGDGTLTGNSFIPSRNDGGGTTCPDAGVENLRLSLGTASFAMGMGVHAHRAVGFFADQIDITSCFIGLMLANNSYLSRIGNFKITGNARSSLLLSLGGASGVTTIFGQNQLEGSGKNCVMVGIRFSGLSWEGQTYMTAGTAYAAWIMTQPATCKVSGIGFSDENTNTDFGLAAAFFASGTGHYKCELDCGWEMFHTDTQPVIVNVGTPGSNTRYLLSGRIKQNDPKGFAVKFQGPYAGAEGELGIVTQPDGNQLTNRPGMLRRAAPLATILRESQSASIAARPIMSVARADLDARLMPTGSVPLSGLSAIDSIMPNDGDVIFLSNAQTAGAERGLWVAHTGAWTRPTVFDASGDLSRGMRVRVLEGTANAGKEFVLNTKPAYVLGTTSLDWYEFAPPVPIAGLYDVDVLLQCTTLGAGTVKIGVGGTDPAGAYTVETATLGMIATGRLSARLRVEADGIAPLTWSAAVAGTPGGARYRVRITARKVPQELS